MTINKSSGLIVSGNATMDLAMSNITTIRCKGNIALADSRIIVVDSSESTISICGCRIFQVYLVGSECSMRNTTAIFVWASDSNISFKSSASAIFDVHGGQIGVLDSRVPYWLRVYEDSTVNVNNSTIWFGLIYHDVQASIVGLTSGHISRLSVHSANGWRIDIESSSVLGWDIISFSSNISIMASSIGWIYAYYSSSIYLENSSAMLLRITHESSAQAHSCIIDAVYASGSSNASLFESILGAIYVLGHPTVRIYGCVFSMTVGMASGASVHITDSSGGYVAVFENTTIIVESSRIVAYLSFEHTSLRLNGLSPGYVEAWDSSSLPVSVSWRMSIRKSWVSWAIDLSYSDALLSNCMLSDLYASSSNISIISSEISDNMAIIDTSMTVLSSHIGGIDIVWGSEVLLRNTSAPVLYVIDSRVDLVDSLAGLVLCFLVGNHSGVLRPGYYEDGCLSDFFHTSSDTQIMLRNSSIIGWSILALGMTGKVNVYCWNSQLIGVGAAYNASVRIYNSYVYGYSEFLAEDTTPEMLLADTITRLYIMTYIRGLSIRLENMSNIRHGFYGELVPGLILHNVTICGIDLEAYYANISIMDSALSSVTATVSRVLVQNSSVGSLEAVMSECSIMSSSIGFFSTVASRAVVRSSNVARFRPYFSESRVESSEMGMDIYVLYASISLSGLKPRKYGHAVLGLDIPVFSSGELIDVAIARWYVTLDEFSSARISHSTIEKIVVGGHNVDLLVADSEVGSVVLSHGGAVEIYDSSFGLDLDISHADLKICVKQKHYKSADTSSLFGEGALFDISIRNATILSVNISASASNIVISDAECLYVTAYMSKVVVEGSKITGFYGLAGTRVSVSDSWIRLLSGGLGGIVEIRSSVFGAVAMFLYGNISLSGNMSSVLRNRQTFSTVSYYNSELMDITLVAGYVSNVTAWNVSIFWALADGLARICLRDIMLEYPAEAMDLAEIYIMFSLSVDIIYDFQRPRTAEITIIGNRTTIRDTAENGYYSTILPQGIVRSWKRLDLGTYTIIARVGLFSSSERIYLWKPMRVTIRIIGPITIATPIAFILAVVYVVIRIIRPTMAREVIGKSTGSGEEPSFPAGEGT